MALSNAEKVRAFRERQKNKKQRDLRLPQANKMQAVFVEPFFEFMQRNGNTSDFDQAFDMMGLEGPDFTDDSGPVSHLGSFERIPELKDSVFPDTARSLDRAELMIGCLLDAATTLAEIVNSFKKREIEARITEISNSDLSDPVRKLDAMDKIIALAKLKEQLEKDIRWPVRRWVVEIE